MYINPNKHFSQRDDFFNSSISLMNNKILKYKTENQKNEIADFFKHDM